MIAASSLSARCGVIGTTRNIDMDWGTPVSDRLGSPDTPSPLTGHFRRGAGDAISSTDRNDAPHGAGTKLLPNLTTVSGGMAVVDGGAVGFGL